MLTVKAIELKHFNNKKPFSSAADDFIWVCSSQQAVASFSFIYLLPREVDLGWAIRGRLICYLGEKCIGEHFTEKEAKVENDLIIFSFCQISNEPKVTPDNHTDACLDPV